MVQGLRNYVILFAVLAFSVSLTACENSGDPGKTSAKPAKTQKKKPAKKQKQSSTAELNGAPADSSGTDTIPSAVNPPDSLYQDLVETPDYGYDDDAPDTMDYFLAADTVLSDSVGTREYSEEDLPEDPDYSDEGNYTEPGGRLEKERLLRTDVIRVSLPDYKNEYDSALAVVEKRISIKPESVSRVITVERWLSPVNYRGYKFNRKKLMLYGVDPEMPIHIYFYLNEYYLSLHDRIYYLDETADNTHFVQVKDTLLSNYLKKYENRL